MTVERDSRTKLRSTVIRARSTVSDEGDDIRRAQGRLYRENVKTLGAGPGSRNELLKTAVPYLLHVVCEQLVLEFLLRHYREIGKLAGWRATLDEHETSIRSLIDGTVRDYPEKLSFSERAIYGQLRDDTERAAFRIIRDLAKCDATERQCPPGVLILSRPELAARLASSSFSSARAILCKRFANDLGIIEVETRGLQRTKGQRGGATRWRWMLPDGDVTKSVDAIK
jgi:hypothetical protein